MVFFQYCQLTEAPSTGVKANSIQASSRSTASFTNESAQSCRTKAALDLLEASYILFLPTVWAPHMDSLVLSPDVGH